MTKFQPRWTREQVRAVEEAALTYGYTAERAWAAAHAGTLPGLGERLEPFEIAKSTTRFYITKARRAALQLEEANGDPAVMLQQEAHELVVEYKRLVSTKRRGQRLDAAALVELAKAGREVHAFLRALDPPKSRRGGASGTVETHAEAAEAEKRQGDNSAERGDWIDAQALAQNGRQ